MSYFTRYMDKCSRLHSFPVTRYTILIVRLRNVSSCYKYCCR